MLELPELTFAFLQQRPESAARALELLSAADATEVLRRVPSRIAAPVVSAMSSVSAARCVALLTPDAAAALCVAMSWPDASALLRQLDGPTREPVLAALPDKLAQRFRRSLDYSVETVGAWIEMDVASIPEDRTVGDATQLLARAPVQSASHLLLTDAAQRYAGSVAFAALLKSASSTRLSTLADRDVAPLQDSATLASVAQHPAWDLASVLPVVSHREELLGGLTRRTLHKAMDQAAHAPSGERPSLLAELLKAYLQSGEGLLRLLVQGPGPVPPEGRGSRR